MSGPRPRSDAVLRPWFPSKFRVAAAVAFACAGPIESAAADEAQFGRHDLNPVARFAAPEAVQAVAVDKRRFYAIANAAIGRYDKHSGELVDRWRASDDLD